MYKKKHDGISYFTPAHGVFCDGTAAVDPSTSKAWPSVDDVLAPLHFKRSQVPHEVYIDEGSGLKALVVRWE